MGDHGRGHSIRQVTYHWVLQVFGTFLPNLRHMSLPDVAPMEQTASNDLIRAVVTAYARAKGRHLDPAPAYQAAVRVLMDRNRNLTPDDAVDCLLAMLAHAARYHPEWLQVEQPVSGAFLRRCKRTPAKSTE
jgi:hypothetical protein